mmetsp:Transcript_74470/g.131618  ORF Transcript_74470/g.131618 Transcript_74470/m.131618 type:complete len:276 (+) Transcript_74470:1502-2329(+)
MIHLNQPRLARGVEHDVEPQQLETGHPKVIAVHDGTAVALRQRPGDRDEGLDHCGVHAVPDMGRVIPLLLEPAVQEPEISLAACVALLRVLVEDKLVTLLVDSVVGDVLAGDGDVLVGRRGVILSTDAHQAVSEEKDPQGGDGEQQDIAPQVKLPPLDEHGVRQVLLHHSVLEHLLRRGSSHEDALPHATAVGLHNVEGLLLFPLRLRALGRAVRQVLAVVSVTLGDEVEIVWEVLAHPVDVDRKRNLACNHIHGGEVVDCLVCLVHAHDTLRGD